MATATFAAGCFWGVEARFRCLPGVLDSEVGYTGGHTENPTYREVCSDRTGHAEAVKLEFDPDLISFERLLQEFFDMHDPTLLNRQGMDVGSQYRSAIFFHDEQQQAQARAAVRRLQISGRVLGTIVTEIVPAGPFWRAEAYHQRYDEKRGRHVCKA